MKNKFFYKTQINKSLKYIDDHLDEDISIQQLANVSNFSLYHFQRIFKIMMNETPYESIKRLRLAKSIFLLQHHPTLKIEDIAFRCGFNSFENFSRQFKNKYGFTASHFRLNDELQNSRIYQDPSADGFYLVYEESRKMKSVPFNVTIESMEKIKIAFVRATYGTDGSELLKAYEHLMDWAKSKGYFHLNAKRFGMSIDNPEVTPANSYRYDFAISVPEGTQPEGIIEIGEIPSTKFATLHCQGDINKIAQAWDFLYKKWLIQSDYAPMHYPAIEEFVRGPEEIGWERFDIKCRIPLEVP